MWEFKFFYVTFAFLWLSISKTKKPLRSKKTTYHTPIAVHPKKKNGGCSLTLPYPVSHGITCKMPPPPPPTVDYFYLQ